MGVSFDKVCFVISPIGADDSPQRQAADRLLKYIVRPVMKKFDYRVERADTIDHPGTITKQIIEYLVESPIVIADMTDLNPNVFYELAVRHAINRPVVHMIAEGHQIPFDVAPERAIFYALDLEGAEAAQDRLEKFVAAISSGDVRSESPLTNALERISLGRSVDPGDRRESQMMEALQDIQVRMINLESKYDARLKDAVELQRLQRRVIRLLSVVDEFDQVASGIEGMPDLKRLSAVLRERLVDIIQSVAGDLYVMNFDNKVWKLGSIHMSGKGTMGVPDVQAE